ncbi:MAG: chromate transporter [Firmicutes bacterium]|nr:chromate transporter [Bacillota bacterium]
MRKKTEEYIELFWEFFKIGALTIGGGAAMIPQMQQIAVEDKKWLTKEEILDCIAMSQSLPGVIAVNMATFIGYKKRKTLGAVVATAGVVVPAFLAIVIALAFLDQLWDNAFVQGAFMGIKAAVCGLILVSALKLVQKIDVFTVVMAIGALVAVGFLGVNAVVVILASIVIGIAYNTIRAKKLSDGRDDL